MSLNVLPLTNSISVTLLQWIFIPLSSVYSTYAQKEEHVIMFSTAAINLHFWDCSGGLSSRDHSRAFTAVS